MWPEWTKLEFPPMVSVEWLKDYIGKNSATLADPKLRILDGSWQLPWTKRSAFEEWKTEHIPGALFFDIVKCADTTDPKKSFMPPSVEKFEEYVKELGINNDTHVVVYDNLEMLGMLSAPRVWWLFRIFGHNRVSVVDGGLPAWKKSVDDVKLTADVAEVKPGTFTAKYRPELLKSFEDVVENVKAEGKKFQLIDARPPGRFEGTAPEPNTELKSGHVVGARNMAIPWIIDQPTKKVKGRGAMLAAFDKVEIKLDEPIVTMCGTGISASNIALALSMLGVDNVPIYEGSWPEWHHRAEDSMKAMGPA